MFPAPFEYRKVRSTEEALAALAQAGAEARILAGGQSLIPAMRYRLASPSMLVDINSIDALDFIREDGGDLVIGACARDASIEKSSIIKSRYPMLKDASALVADPVVRQMGTVVGSLCHCDPAGDWPVVALTGRAKITIQSAKGSRTVAIDDFLIDSFSTAVQQGEMAIEVRFPSPGDRTAAAYLKIERKVGDFATTCAGTRVTLAADGTIADASVAIGAVGPKAMRVTAAEKLLKGQKPSKDVLRAAADEAKKLADPTPDTRGSAEFKKAMAGVLVGRALATTFERLGVGGFK